MKKQKKLTMFERDHPDVPPLLDHRRKQKKRKKYKRRKVHRGHIPNRRSIHKRPEEINNRPRKILGYMRAKEKFVQLLEEAKGCD